MKTYRVTARRTGTGWDLHVPDLGTVLPTRSLNLAEKTARAHIADKTGADEDQVVVQVAPKLDITLGQAVADARQAVADAAEKQTEAARKSRDVVAQLKDAGMSNGDIATILGVSDQRVSQLLGKLGTKKAG